MVHSSKRVLPTPIRELLWLVVGLVATLSVGFACSPRAETSHDEITASDSVYTYDFSQPDAEFKLDNDLEEISGLTLFDDRNLAAVEDEHGHFYLIDFETGEITEEHKFAGKGDYEGIERAGDRLFALRSDGQVREIVDYDTDDPNSDKVKTPLGSSCDAEGLAYDQAQNRLLISCKEHPGHGLKGVRAIYALELDSMEMSNQPVFTIPVDTIDALGGAPGNVVSRFITPLVDFGGFKPSALAVHPLTGDLFVLSSVLKVIVVLDPSGEIVALFPLDRDLLEQPEGLAFLPNGDLFISSEGDKRKARLVRFNNRVDPGPAENR